MLAITAEQAFGKIKFAIAKFLQQVQQRQIDGTVSHQSRQTLTRHAVQTYCAVGGLLFGGMYGTGVENVSCVRVCENHSQLRRHFLTAASYISLNDPFAHAKIHTKT